MRERKFEKPAQIVKNQIQLIVFDTPKQANKWFACLFIPKLVGGI